LITPQSTVRGKGYWGPVEGLELMLNLSKIGSSFVNSPLNFRRVQVADLHLPPCWARDLEHGYVHLLCKNQPPGLPHRLTAHCTLHTSSWKHARLSVLSLRLAVLQEALRQGGCVGKLAVKEESWLHNERPGFSGAHQ
jgi:hypothetical protein